MSVNCRVKALGEKFVELSKNFTGLDQRELLEKYIGLVWKGYENLYERLVAKWRISLDNLKPATRFVAENRARILETKSLILKMLKNCFEKVCNLFDVSDLDVDVVLFVGTMNVDGFIDIFEDREALFIGYEKASLHYPKFLEVFLCHEITHIVHMKILSKNLNLPLDKLFNEVLDWWFTAALIWEGLATVASKVLVPGFSDEEYLFCNMPNCGNYKWFEENRDFLLRGAKELLDAKDFEVFRNYFMGGSHPEDISSPRSGYYIGYLVVKEAVEKIGFPRFIRLHPDDWRRTVLSVVEQRKQC